jgi:hypothetical protein
MRVASHERTIQRLEDEVSSTREAAARAEVCGDLCFQSRTASFCELASPYFWDKPTCLFSNHPQHELQRPIHAPVGHALVTSTLSVFLNDAFFPLAAVSAGLCVSPVPCALA